MRGTERGTVRAAQDNAGKSPGPEPLPQLVDPGWGEINKFSPQPGGWE